MSNLIVILILLAIVGAAATYVIRARKQGRKCIGCPNSKQCGNGCCGCGDNQ